MWNPSKWFFMKMNIKWILSKFTIIILAPNIWANAQKSITTNKQFSERSQSPHVWFKRWSWTPKQPRSTPNSAQYIHICMYTPCNVYIIHLTIGFLSTLFFLWLFIWFDLTFKFTLLTCVFRFRFYCNIFLKFMSTFYSTIIGIFAIYMLMKKLSMQFLFITPLMHRFVLSSLFFYYIYIFIYLHEISLSARYFVTIHTDLVVFVVFTFICSLYSDLEFRFWFLAVFFMIRMKYFYIWRLNWIISRSTRLHKI